MGNILLGPINTMIGNMLTILVIALVAYYILWDVIVKDITKFVEKIVKDAIDELKKIRL
jgi:phage-related minor tail protein